MPARLPDIIVGFGLGVGVFALVTLIFSLQTSPQQPETDVITRDQFWLMAFNGILALATVVLAISTIGLWKYAGGQAHDMQELLRTMKGQLEGGKTVFRCGSSLRPTQPLREPLRSLDGSQKTSRYYI